MKIRHRIFIASDQIDLRLTLIGPAEDPTENPIANNIPRAPYYCAEGKEVLLSNKESELISKLLDICAQYERQGEEHLSATVERIGMSLMQFFMSRSHIEPKT